MKGGVTVVDALNPLEVTSARGGGVGTIEEGVPGMRPLFCLHLCELEAAVRSQDTDAWYLETGSFLPTLVPTGCVQAAPGTRAQLPATWLGWGRGSFACTAGSVDQN